VPAELADVKCFGRGVTLAGTMRADRLEGTRHRDVIVARGGDDVVVDVEKNDRVCAGGGNDRVLIVSRQSYAYVDLGVGDDRFSGRARLVRGGSGADRIRADQAVNIAPGPGRDVVLARPVKDRYDAPCLSYDRSPRRIVADLTRGWVKGQGVDRVRGVQCLYGSRFADTITGSPRNDRLNACSPETWSADRVRNVVHAGAGNDEVNMCNGGDFVHLGDGNDIAMGGPGDDWVYGGGGRDHIWGIGGSDHLVGGDGNDQVNGTYYCDIGSSAGSGMGDSSPNQVWGGDGDDEVTGDLAADLLDGGPGFDHGYGGPPGREGDDAIVSVERLTSCP
jgi:Ca2+-binding RTX toxin-like protein